VVFSQRDPAIPLALLLDISLQGRASLISAPEAPAMRVLQIPAYSRFHFELADPDGGPPRQADVIVSPADLWPHWPEALDPRWSALEIGPLTVALRVEGLDPAR
jgi:hypothetical protein